MYHDAVLVSVALSLDAADEGRGHLKADEAEVADDERGQVPAKVRAEG